MAVRLQLPPPLPPPLPPLLPLLLCIWSFLRLASPLTDANWPPLSVQKVFNLTNLTDDEAYLVRESVRIAAARMESVLKVLDLNPGQPLLLNRSPSHCAYWSGSADNEKCTQLNEAYLTTGEQCSPDLAFNIPQRYLSELAVYNSSKMIIKAAGAGVSGFNFILFVTSLRAPACRHWEEKPIQSMTCSQLGKAKRPLAGVLNVCPQMINSELASRSSRLLHLALAGLVRILGFSGKLITKFQRHGVDASGGDSWTTVHEAERTTSQGGRTFIRTPAVLGFAQRYFNCSLGIPLAPGSDSDAWDQAFMLQSALSASPILPGSLDEATLALLNDSGWYRANYSLADPIVWGRRAGCWFSQSCATSPNAPETSFCYDTVSEATPLDLSHRYEGPCTRIGGTNCSAVLPLYSRSCPLSGNWRRLQLFDRSQRSNWTECLSVDCRSNGANLTYAVTRNGLRVVCNGSSAKEILLNGSVRLLCTHYNLVCPRLSSVLDLLSGFRWPPLRVSTTHLATGPDPNLNFFSGLDSASKRFVRSLSSDVTSNSTDSMPSSDAKTNINSTSTSFSTSAGNSSSPRAVYSTSAGNSVSSIANTSLSSSSKSSIIITTPSHSTAESTSPVLSASARSSLSPTSGPAATASSTGADTMTNANSSSSSSTIAGGRLSTSSSPATTVTIAASAASTTTTHTLGRTTIVSGISHVVRLSPSEQLRKVLQTSSSSYQRTPTAKFSIRFATMDFFDLVKRDLVSAFKASLHRSLVAAFQTSQEYISIGDVRLGSVIAIWVNSDPILDPATKLELISNKVRTGSIIVQINGVNYTAASVESYTGTDDNSTFPLMEVITGSVVGLLLLIGFILVIVLVAMKHKINRPRMQVRPRSVDSSPTTSSQVSRQCSAAPSGIMQLTFLGGAGPAPSRRAVADVELTSSGGRLSSCSGAERGVSAGSVGLQFSNSALYFDV